MSISQRKDGRIVVKYKDGDTWRQRAFSGPDAEQDAATFDAECVASQISPAERLTLGELVMLYCRSNPELHRDTKRKIVYFLAGHEEDGRHIQGGGEWLRDKYAESLTRQDLERMREHYRGRGASNTTANKMQAYLRAILAWGVDQSLIVINPWRDYRRLKADRPVTHATALDMRRVYAELPEYLQWAVKVCYFLSLRFGQVELLTLLWSAFDWRRRIVIVRQGKSGRLKSVMLHPEFAAEAYARYQQDMRAGIVLVCHNGGRRVLAYGKIWAQACKRAGVQMRPYDVRHIAATEMLARGADLAAVSAQLGHASVTTTGATYTHVTPGGQAHAASIMPAIEVCEPVEIDVAPSHLVRTTRKLPK